jgi:hypothetical protein
MLVGGGVLGMLFLVNEMPATQVREEVIYENRYILWDSTFVVDTNYGWEGCHKRLDCMIAREVG